MFGFSKEKPLIEGPIEFEIEVEIDRAASDVYPLLDVADSRFAQVQLGNTVSPIEGTDDRYTLVLQEMEDLTFHFLVTERVPGKRHTLECVIEPGIGNLVKTVESHTVEPRGENACLIGFKVEATFADGLSDAEIAQEVAIMSMSVENDLTKLVLLAEQGVDAVRAFEAEQFDEF